MRTQWEYRDVGCWYVVTKPKPLLGGSEEGYWRLDVEDCALEEGLNLMGQDGWELVTVQPSKWPHGGGMTQTYWDRPTYRYIFKRPI